MPRGPSIRLPLVTLRPEDAAYMAGFIDGEGCISTRYYPSSKRVRVRVDVWQQDPRPLQWMQSLMGGHLYLAHCRSNKLSQTPMWAYGFFDALIDHYLPQILPYLKVKKEKAELALQMRALLRKNGHKSNISEEEQKERMAIVALAANRIRRVV